MLGLGSCEWIRHHHNVIIVGPTETGKTYLSRALAQKACREGMGTFYVRTRSSTIPSRYPGPTGAMHGPWENW